MMFALLLLSLWTEYCFGLADQLRISYTPLKTIANGARSSGGFSPQVGKNLSLVARDLLGGFQLFGRQPECPAGTCTTKLRSESRTKANTGSQMNAPMVAAVTSGITASLADAARVKTWHAVLMAAMILPLKSAAPMEKRVKQVMNASQRVVAVQMETFHVAVTAAMTLTLKFAVKTPASTAKKATAAWPMGVVQPANNHVDLQTATIQPTRYVALLMTQPGDVSLRRPAVMKPKPATTKTRRFAVREVPALTPIHVAQTNAVDRSRPVELMVSAR